MPGLTADSEILAVSEGCPRQIIKRHKHVLTGVNDHGVHCQPVFITFDNDKTAKFYDISLRQIVILQGCEIQKLIHNEILAK